MRIEYLLRDFLGRKFQVYLKEWFLSHIICMHMNLFVQSLSHVQLFAAPWIAARQASLSIGISQARILERVAISFSRGSSRPRDWTRISHISRWILYHWATREVCMNLYLSSVYFCRHHILRSYILTHSNNLPFNRCQILFCFEPF